MKQGEIQQMLVATNRWWRHPHDWMRDDPDLREANDAPFRYSAGVLKGLAPGGLYVLRGPRRVGKSVEIKHAVERLIADGVESRRILHASVDGWRAADLGRLVNAARQLTHGDSQRFWFIDEVTGITDGWPERIKWLRDNDGQFRRDTVVLTGSSAADLTGSVKALAGRRGPVSHADRVMLPMGFRTWAALTGERPPPADIGPYRVADLTPRRLVETAQELVPWLDWLVLAWDTYLQVGGFPTAVANHIQLRELAPPFLDSLLDVIHGDAFRRADWSRVQTTAFLRRAVRGLCSPVNYATLADDLDISQPTARRRFDELREAFVVWPCHRQAELRPKLNARAKVYFVDPVYIHLAGPTPDDSLVSEQQLGMALLRSFEREQPGSFVEFDQVLHHRSNTRREIDFVGRNFGGVAIESKHVDGRWRRNAQTLRASGWRGIVATRSELDLDDAELIAMPTAMLAWLVDG